jgi:hypothetical protein
MSLEEEQVSTPETVENQVDSEVKTPENGEPTTPETDEEKNARVQAEAAAKAQQREEKKQQSIQKRFNELTAEKYSAQKLADQLAEQNARILALLEGKQGNQIPTDAEPKREQFTDYEDFITARAEYRAEQKALAIVEKFSKTQEETQTERSRQSEDAKVQKEFLERRAAVEKTLPDFRETVEDWEPKLPDSVVETIIRMPDGPLISYHLAKNPELEAQFRDSPAYMHGVLLGQLSATLKSQTKVTAAPNPGKPVTQKPGTSNEPPSNPELYYEWAKKHLR